MIVHLTWKMLWIMSFQEVVILHLMTFYTESSRRKTCMYIVRLIPEFTELNIKAANCLIEGVLYTRGCEGVLYT